MSDLCAPVYIVTDADEEMSFWCFVAIMARMVRLPVWPSRHTTLTSASQKQNFLRDQSGMKRQLSTLQQLIHVMDPDLYRHLGWYISFPWLYEQCLISGPREGRCA